MAGPMWSVPGWRGPWTWEHAVLALDRINPTVAARIARARLPDGLRPETLAVRTALAPSWKFMKFWMKLSRFILKL